MATLLRYSFPLERIFRTSILIFGRSPGDPWRAQQLTVYFGKRFLRPGRNKKHKKIKFDKQKKVSSGNEGDGVYSLRTNAEPTASRLSTLSISELWNESRVPLVISLIYLIA